MSCIVNLEHLSSETRQKISKDLEVAPRDSKYGKKESVLCFDTFNVDDGKGDEDCYVSLPFSYTYQNMRNELKISLPNEEIEFPRASGYTFDGTLNSIQTEIKDETYDILNRTRSILISLYCGAGKTAYSIFLCSKLQYKVCVLCHRINLIDQWEYAINKFCPEALVQVLQGNTPIDPDADFYIMNVANVSKRSVNDFNHVGILVIDECFPGNTYVITSDGNKKIKDLHNMVPSTRPLILSFNQSTKKFEYKRMLNSWEKPLVKDIVEIYMGKRKITCTSDHKILTINGYMKAIDLKLGDNIIANKIHKLRSDITYILNSDQEQIMIGSFLGDGHISISPSGLTRLKIQHGIKQEEYCKWKSTMFNCNIQYIEKNGYAQTRALRFTTKSFYYDVEFPKNKYSCPKELINRMDGRGLAIWYMDDGNISRKGNSIVFSTHSFDEISQDLLVDKLNSMGIYSSKKKVKKGGDEYWVIYISNHGVKKLIEIVYPYIHDNLKYKILPQDLLDQLSDYNKDLNDVFTKKEYVPINKRYYGMEIKAIGNKNNIKRYKWVRCDKCLQNLYLHWRHEQMNWHNCPCIKLKNSKIILYDISLLNSAYIWNNKYEEYGCLRVSNVLLFSKYNEKFVYDIEVEDNHNFTIATNSKAIDGPVVSNCHTICTENLSRSLFYFKPKYLIGLTATPDRTDGMGKILDLYFGSERISRKLYRPFNSYVYNTGFKPKSEQTAQGRLDWNSVLSSQGGDDDRNEMIVDTIRYFKTRNFLVLCKRVDQANTLLKKLKAAGEDVDIFVSTSRKFDRDSRILISTYSKTGVGFDHPRLDALIIASDVEEGIEQYVGRVFRREDVVPIVFDFLDKMHTLFKHFLTRRLLYLSIGGDVKQFDMSFPEFVKWRKMYKC